MSTLEQTELICALVLLIGFAIWWLNDSNANDQKLHLCEQYAQAHGGHVEGYADGHAYRSKYGEQFTGAGFKVVMPNGNVVYDKDLLRQ